MRAIGNHENNQVANPRVLPTSERNQPCYPHANLTLVILIDTAIGHSQFALRVVFLDARSPARNVAHVMPARMIGIP